MIVSCRDFWSEERKQLDLALACRTSYLPESADHMTWHPATSLAPANALAADNSHHQPQIRLLVLRYCPQFSHTSGSIVDMSYIPSLTLPAAVFNSPAISILLPVGLGLGQGLLSQPGKSTPKSTSDAPNPERKTFRKDVQTKYKAIKQPPLRPPPWIFAPVWTTLYALMGYAAHSAWKNGMASMNPRVIEDTRRGATLYTIQLALNQLFMPLFFGFGRPVEALVDMVALTGTVGYLAYIWNKVDQTASRCLWPYLAWLGFATYLTAGTGYLNGWSFETKEEGTAEAVDKKEL